MTPERVFDAAARGLAGAAALLLVVMMMITVVDVGLRTFFSIPIFGTFDLVELTLVGVIYLAIPGTFLREEHVVVDVIDAVTPREVQQALRMLGLLLALVFLIVMEFHMVQPALDMWTFGDRTLDLGIPRYVHWLPIHVGTVCSILAVAAILVRDLLRAAPFRKVE